jgi:hypothetical protein
VASTGWDVDQRRVWNDITMDAVEACIPDPDPGELFSEDMNVQLFGLNGTPDSNPPPMNGFIDNYMRQPQTTPGHDPMAVMHYLRRSRCP